MANSISLTTDMKSLYLMLNSGLPQGFSLAGNGVYITSILNDVHVVAAPTALTNGTDECLIPGDAQWQCAFHSDTTELVMIGNDDMEAGFTAEIKKFNLSKGAVVNLRLNSTETKILIRTS